MHAPEADIGGVFNGHPATIPTLDKAARFSLDTSGVAGLLDGDGAVFSMAAVHLYGGRRWLGWYNSPGSLQIAERLSSFVKSAPSSTGSLSQSVHMDPAALLRSDGSKGPKFRAAHSGTVIEETSHLAALFMKECGAWNSDGTIVEGRQTQSIRITIAKLLDAPAPEMHPICTHASTLVLASIPIAVSLGACALSAACKDWYASSLILVGVVASGVSCRVLGSADIVFTHPEPAKGSPAGDGILGSDKDIVLLKGTEGAVNSITRGQLSVRFSSQVHLGLVRLCSVLFLIQCLTQLLLIPQASLLGQIMFLASLGVSGVYSAWVSSSGAGNVVRKVLFEHVLGNPMLRRYTLGTRTSAVVFTLLVLRPSDPTRLLDELLPNDTRVWKQWKGMVLKELQLESKVMFQGKVEPPVEFTQEETKLFETLCGDALAAYQGYRDYVSVD